MSRGVAWFLGGVAVIVAVVGVAYLVWLSGREVPVQVAPKLEERAPEPLTTRVTEALGRVQRKGAVGGWRDVAVGDVLAPGDDLRTDSDAVTKLSYGEQVRVQLLGDTEVQLAESQKGLTRFVVGEGLLFADVLPGAGRVQFVNRKGDAVAETEDGALYVAAEPDGALRAAVTRGEATLESQGKRVVLKAGYVSVARAGRGPEDPQAVPTSLLLKVRWPDAATAKKKHLVRGEASPGTRVRLGKEWVWVAEDGSFSAPVELVEGTQHLNIRAVDVMGRPAEQTSPPIELDTQVPAPAIKTSPNMWRKDLGKDP